MEDHNPENPAQKLQTMLGHGRAYYQPELEKAAAELCCENEEDKILSLYEKVVA